ncbi:MAG: hypothetical protein NTZ64_11825 [Polaromonas sp.]|nr:hypothetical protein [Polaromonas sp.]
MTPKLLTASLLASALFTGLVMAPVMAQQDTYTPGIDRAQQTIDARIQQGVASGQITQPEAQVLYQREREITARESRFKADGHASVQEREQLRADLAGLNAEVDRMLSNRDRMRGASQANSTPGIDRGEMQIGQRIDEGVRSGRITAREARRLHQREREIARHEGRAKSDGVVTPQERQRLRNELAALNAEVNRMMRNRDSYRHDGR